MKDLIVIDTVNGRFFINDKPIERAEKIEVKITPDNTEVTLTLCNHDVILNTEISQLIKEET